MLAEPFPRSHLLDQSRCPRASSSLDKPTLSRRCTGFWGCHLWQWPGIQTQRLDSSHMNNCVMDGAITRIDLADNRLLWWKYSTYFYPCFLPVSRLIIPYRTFTEPLLGRKLGKCCLNVLVHLNENRGFNFSIFWKEKKKNPKNQPKAAFFFFVKLVVFKSDCDKLPVMQLSSLDLLSMCKQGSLQKGHKEEALVLQHGPALNDGHLGLLRSCLPCAEAIIQLHTGRVLSHSSVLPVIMLSNGCPRGSI